MPQEVLRRLAGAMPAAAVTAPSEKRIRTLIQLPDARSWIRSLAPAADPGGRQPPGRPTAAIAIDGERVGGLGDGQVKLFAAALHEETVVIAEHRIPDETTR